MSSNARRFAGFRFCVQHARIAASRYRYRLETRRGETYQGFAGRMHDKCSSDVRVPDANRNPIVLTDWHVVIGGSGQTISEFSQSFPVIGQSIYPPETKA
ncbi:hypothetical protein GIY62_27075 [Burkholderia plantarii]|uniref:hypothetical protein n=1 Tax=Burkholderia plantarii TaxID=41899 RepID=UPI00272B8F3E|nr:hypothetical protein [Burkholderia plantarii]WLE61150.1 hypothetical protein GIY62_27075 [Burkholderia plantarii]